MKVASCSCSKMHGKGSTPVRRSHSSRSKKGSRRGKNRESVKVRTFCSILILHLFELLHFIKNYHTSLPLPLLLGLESPSFNSARLS